MRHSTQHPFALVIIAAAWTGSSLPAADPANASSAPTVPLTSLSAQLDRLVLPAAGWVGVAAALLGTKEAVTLASGERFPMQSVFKLPLAMTVLQAVDRGTLRLDQAVRVTPADFVSESQHSPIRDEHPGGTTLSLTELLRAAVSESDGTAADMLLGLVGGPGRRHSLCPQPGHRRTHGGGHGKGHGPRRPGAVPQLGNPRGGC